MKKIWYIDRNKLELYEGYVSNDYRRYYNEYSNIPIQENGYGDSKTSSKLENIFDDREMAIKIYNMIIMDERTKTYNKIKELQQYNEELFKKLLKI